MTTHRRIGGNYVYCNVEIVLKDISTVRHGPQRLWEWADITMEEAQRIEG